MSVAKSRSSLTVKIKPNFKKYYNVNRLFSYEGISFYLIIGGRGIGKTTGLNIHNVMDFKKRGNEFVYVRRYIAELKKSKGMFDPILNKVKCQGLSNGLMQWEVDKVRIGYGCALTAQQTLKSGVDFTKVNTLVFDEAILPRIGMYRYLENEIEALFELISTIFRDRTGYRVFILGNNADIFNPYFEYFNIPTFEHSYMDKDRGLYCELAQNSAELAEAEKQTPLYKLTQGTQYFDYHYNNKVLIDDAKAIGPKPLNCTLMCRIVINDYTLNIYGTRTVKIYVEIRDKIIKDTFTFVLFEDNNINYHYLRELRGGDVGKYISTAYYTGNATFQDEKAYALFNMMLEAI